MEKMTFSEMADKFREFNRNHNCTQFDQHNYMIGVIVYKAENWIVDYSLESRSYKVHSANKMWLDGMGGSSIFGSNIDGSDKCVRLDWQDWQIDYCYVLKEIHK